MAQKKRTTTKKKTKKQVQQQEKLQMIGIGLLLVVCSILGLFKLGFLGNLIANTLRIIGGNTYPLLCALLGFIGGWLMIKTTAIKLHWSRQLGGALLFYVGLVLFLHTRLYGKMPAEVQQMTSTWDLLAKDLKVNAVLTNVGGGMLGGFIYRITDFLVAQFGSYFVSISAMLSGSYFMSSLTNQQLLQILQTVYEKLQHLFRGGEQRQKNRAARREVRELKKAEKIAHERASIIAEMKTQEKAIAQQVVEPPLPEEPPIVPIDTFQASFVPKEQSLPPEPPVQASFMEEAEPTPEDDGEVLDFEISADQADETYELPSAALLDQIPATDQTSEYQKIEQNIGVLEQTFASFGVDAKVVKASLGPAVTKYEIQPAVGVKVSKIVSLTDDIALALAAKDVRMEAPIPGKSLIGIEVPNSTVSMVSFREVVEAQPASADKLLEVPLGRDISGQVQTADLTKMPHMLIAGSTGSGKSVAINGIITSILMRAKPHEVKLMMVDPKMVELNVYNGIPHLLTPVVTNPRKAAQALQKVVKEMEERYEKFAAVGARNITGYNDFIEQRNRETGEKNPILPFIVVIVDELADLMMVASNEVEDAIIRLAQMARAAGIHMILATQRPSVDVITGIIKANVPSRMAFAVSSGTDSRTIIDSNGAEKLLGRGDMLFLPMGENKPIRIQGAFLSDGEVERIVTFITDQQGANYEEKMMVTEDEVSENGQSVEPQDELYEQAKALVVEMQTASVSLLQRRFRIGYNRAARLVDELEACGVVGPSEGSKPRKVYLQPAPEEMHDLPNE